MGIPEIGSIEAPAFAENVIFAVSVSSATR
jgi:hypothetical protein